MNAVQPEDRAPFAEILCFECEAAAQRPEQEPTPHAADPVDPDLSVFLRDLPSMAWRGKWFIAVALAITLALGVVYLQVAEPVYVVGAQLLVEERGLGFEEAERQRGESKMLPTQAEIIHSPVVIERALAEAPPPQEQISETGEPVNPLAKVMRSLVATPILGTNVLTLSYRCSDPEYGIQLIGAVVRSFRQYLLDLEVQGHTEAVELLRAREEELHDELAELKAQHLELRAGSGLMGEGRDALSVQKSALSQHANILAETQSRRIVLENRLAALRAATSHGAHGTNGNGTSGASVGVTSDIPLAGDGGSGMAAALAEIRTELWRAEARAAEIAHYGDKHPEVRAIHDRIATLRRYLAEGLEAAPRELETELAAARKTEETLLRLYQEEFEKAKALDEYLIRESQLQDEIRRVSDIHRGTLKMLRERELSLRALQKGQAGVLVRTLEGPHIVGDQVWPQPSLVLLQAGLIGLVGGLAVVAIRERAQRRIAANR